MAIDVAILDPDLLQLPNDLPSPSGKPSTEKQLEELFSQWLSLPDTQRVVRRRRLLSFLTVGAFFLCHVSSFVSVVSSAQHQQFFQMLAITIVVACLLPTPRQCSVTSSRLISMARVSGVRNQGKLVLDICWPSLAFVLLLFSKSELWKTIDKLCRSVSHFLLFVQFTFLFLFISRSLSLRQSGAAASFLFFSLQQVTL